MPVAAAGWRVLPLACWGQAAIVALWCCGSARSGPSGCEGAGVCDAGDPWGQAGQPGPVSPRGAGCTERVAGCAQALGPVVARRYIRPASTRSPGTLNAARRLPPRLLGRTGPGRASTDRV